MDDIAMAGGEEADRRVSVDGDGSRVDDAGRNNNDPAPTAQTASTAPAEPPKNWIAGFFAAKVSTEKLSDTDKHPCVMLGEEPAPGYKVGVRSPFEKKIDGERVSIEARTVSE